MDINKLDNLLGKYPSYRSKQVYKAIFEDLYEDWDDVTNLPKDLRNILNKECSLDIKAKIIKSKNGDTAKALIYFDDGLAVETVLMIHKNIKGTRNTVCVSSQIGCKLGCEFCATGSMGFKRDLTFGEIISQVLFFERILKKDNERVDNIVFMGMGEPMLNYENVIKAVRVINEYLKIGARKISISTSGIVPGIQKLITEPLQLNLAVSVHAPNNSLRSKIMPINKKYPLDEVLKAISDYINHTGRKVMIEYVMLKGINDSIENANELAFILKKYLQKLFVVNLISFNPTLNFASSPISKIIEFRRILEKESITVTQRFKFGREVKGACGQLGIES